MKNKQFKYFIGPGSTDLKPHKRQPAPPPPKATLSGVDPYGATDIRLSNVLFRAGGVEMRPSSSIGYADEGIIDINTFNFAIFSHYISVYSPL